MESAGEIMEILEAFDLTGSLPDAGELAGCSHHTRRALRRRSRARRPERPAGRAVREAKVAFKAGRVRVHRPWMTEPGMWLRYDFGDGQVTDGRKTVLFCA